LARVLSILSKYFVDLVGEGYFLGEVDKTYRGRASNEYILTYYIPLFL
jgi:hypothetical protein